MTILHRLPTPLRRVWIEKSGLYRRKRGDFLQEDFHQLRVIQENRQIGQAVLIKIGAGEGSRISAHRIIEMGKHKSSIPLSLQNGDRAVASVANHQIGGLVADKLTGEKMFRSLFAGKIPRRPEGPFAIAQVQGDAVHHGAGAYQVQYPIPVHIVTGDE